MPTTIQLLKKRTEKVGKDGKNHVYWNLFLLLDDGSGKSSPIAFDLVRYNSAIKGLLLFNAKEFETLTHVELK